MVYDFIFASAKHSGRQLRYRLTYWLNRQLYFASTYVGYLYHLNPVRLQIMISINQIDEWIDRADITRLEGHISPPLPISDPCTSRTAIHHQIMVSINQMVQTVLHNIVPFVAVATNGGLLLQQLVLAWRLI